MNRRLALLLFSALTLGFLMYLTVTGLRFAPEGITVRTQHAVRFEDARININTADAEALSELPGIGPKLGAAIVAYREANGPFAVPEDLLHVPGIGEAKLAAMRELLIFGEDKGDTP